MLSIILSSTRGARVTVLALTAALVLANQTFAQSSIRVLVNDRPITSFDIQQRTAMLRAFTRGRQGEEAAIEQLIDEQLMTQEASRHGVEISDEDVERLFAGRANDAKLTAAQFAQAMRQAGFGPETFREFLRANMAWQKVVAARFRATEKITDQDVTAALAGREDLPEEQKTIWEYRLQQILFIVPADAGSNVEAQQRAEASAFRDAFQGCDNSLQQAAGRPGIVVKPPIRRDETDMSDSMRESLAALEVGGIIDPERVAEGFQLVAVCAKTPVEGESEASVQVREELSDERSKLMARRYLRDLRSDAVIEYR
jgi:peptidyl-prolyl cis-trans isomerase SurA